MFNLTGPNDLQILLSQQENSINSIKSYINDRLAPLKKSLDFVVIEATDPWERIHSEVSSISKKAGASSLDPISEYYNIPKSKYCMVLGKVANCDIVCSHLWPRSTAGRGLETLGLEISDLSSPRNFLRLHNTIEKAFDRKRLTFLPADDFVSDGKSPLSLKVVILDPNLAQETLKYRDSNGNDVTKFLGNLHNTTFQFKFPVGRFPFLRIIALHASRAHQKAVGNMWIQDDDNMYERRLRAFELARLSLSETNDNSLVMERFFADL